MKEKVIAQYQLNELSKDEIIDVCQSVYVDGRVIQSELNGITQEILKLTNSASPLGDLSVELLSNLTEQLHSKCWEFRQSYENKKIVQERLKEIEKQEAQTNVIDYDNLTDKLNENYEAEIDSIQNKNTKKTTH